MSSIPPWSAGNASPATLGPGAGNAFGVQGRAPVAGERRPWPLRDGSGVCIVSGLTVIGWNGIHLAEVARGVPIERVGAATGGVIVFTFIGVVPGPSHFAAIGGRLGGDIRRHRGGGRQGCEALVRGRCEPLAAALGAGVRGRGTADAGAGRGGRQVQSRCGLNPPPSSPYHSMVALTDGARRSNADVISRYGCPFGRT